MLFNFGRINHIPIMKNRHFFKNLVSFLRPTFRIEYTKRSIQNNSSIIYRINLISKNLS